MKPQSRWLAGFLPATTIFGSVEACAEPITFQFEGHITRIHDYLELDESVFVGAPFSGSYTFDPAGVGDFYPDDPRVGFYPFGPAGQMWAKLGNYEFATNDLGILIWNDLLSGDLYEPTNSAPFEAAGIQWSAMSIVLNDRSRMALNSDALPLSVPVLEAFPDFHGLLLDFPGDTNGIRGVITSLTPEPGSVTLVSLGGLIILSRRKCGRGDCIDTGN